MKGQLLHKRKSLDLSKRHSFDDTRPTISNFNSFFHCKRRTNAGSQSINLRKSFDEPTTEIYFDSSKKSKFMKGIVDGYFNEGMQNLLTLNTQDEGRELQEISRGIRGVLRRKKIGNSSLSDTNTRIFKSFNSSLNCSPTKKNNSEAPIRTNLIFPQHDEQPQQMLEASPTASSSSNLAGSLLPPIHETYEQSQQLAKVFPQMANLATQVEIKDQSLTKVVTFENQAFQIGLSIFQGKPQHRLKQYKPAGIQLMKRQERAHKFGLEGIWQPSKLSSNTFISQMVQPIKNSICRMIPTLQGSCKYKVRSSPYRKYLLSNNCQELKHLIRQICHILKKVQGRVLNNKINPVNIFVFKGNQVRIGEWAYSSFRDEYDIQKKKFQSRVNPILRSQDQWLATPEYLSPQILMAIVATCEQEQPDIWENGSASDIWSLGMTIFEILTMIPVWINQVCAVKTSQRKNIGRIGLLGTDNRSPHKIMALQKRLNKAIRKCFDQQIMEQIPSQILNLVEKMLILNPAERITLDQILNILK